jgi:peptidyl-tRNA hydrolase, PTH1 family
MSSPVRLVVGLGNPGPRYARTRHNAGFWFADELADRAGGEFRPAGRFFGDACEGRVKGQVFRLLKPRTFMNRSGQSVAAMVNYYRLPLEQVLVAHDEIDLPAGTVRLKRGGGHGGHNGLRDIVSHLGGSDFLRLRIGVGHPGTKDDVHDHVLHRAPAAEETIIEEAVARALDQFSVIVTGDLEGAMNVLHRDADPPADNEPPPAAEDR